MSLATDSITAKDQDLTSVMASLKIKKGASSIPPLQSAFAMSETLQLLILRDPHDVDALVEVPECFLSTGGISGGAREESSGSGVGEGRSKEVDLWILEHLRILPLSLNPLITSLLPVCSRETCPEMRAGEWQYVCVAHAMELSTAGGGSGSGGGPGASEAGSVNGDAGGEGRECCAIDYILHTIDSHTALLNSSHAFPSRLTIKPGSSRHFPQQARRLSRIFAHAYHHHPEVFHAAEAETGLYARFHGLTQRYGLVGEELLNVPKEVIRERGGKEMEHRDGEGEAPAGTGEDLDEDDLNVSFDRGTLSAETDSDEHPSQPENTASDEDDDAEFRRDDSGAPKTSHKISGGMGTLGRSSGRNGGGRGGKTRRALFPVDVVDERAEEEEEDVVEPAPTAETEDVEKDTAGTEQGAS